MNLHATNEYSCKTLKHFIHISSCFLLLKATCQLMPVHGINSLNFLCHIQLNKLIVFILVRPVDHLFSEVHVAILCFDRRVFFSNRKTRHSLYTNPFNCITPKRKIYSLKEIIWLNSYNQWYIPRNVQNFVFRKLINSHDVRSFDSFECISFYHKWQLKRVTWFQRENSVMSIR